MTDDPVTAPVAQALSDGFFDVPAAKIATIVTHLEMLSRPPHRASAVVASGIAIGRVTAPALDWYRDLFRRIGEPWLWFSRLRMSDDALSAIIRHPDVEVWSLVVDGRDEGLLELDFRQAGQCELAFFGLTPGLVGQGAGRLLMGQAIARAWARPISRFWVHTCTLDHPAALGFYMRSGFVPYRRQVEIADDPRATGEAPRDTAPHFPLLEGGR